MVTSQWLYDFMWKRVEEGNVRKIRIEDMYKASLPILLYFPYLSFDLTQQLFPFISSIIYKYEI